MRTLPSAPLLFSSFLALLAACGSPATSPADGTSSGPGWRSISPAPPATLGTLHLRQSGAVLEGELSTQEGDEPSGELAVLVRWDGSAIEHPIATLRAADGERFRGPLEPQQCKGTSKGTVIVRSGGALVGVSSIDRALFRAPYVVSFQIEKGCAALPAVEKPLPPLRLARDPRLPLALCASDETGPVRCGLEVLPDVRVESASASIASDGSVLLSFSPVYVPPGETPELAINGERVATPSPDVWQARLPSRDAAPLRAGENEIVWSIGTRPPWRARLELPRTDLRPRTGALQVGRPFVVETELASWARSYDVSIEPIASPPIKASISFSSSTPRIEGVFDGFTHTGRTTPAPTAARLSTSARGGRRGFDVTQSESIEVPIL